MAVQAIPTVRRRARMRLSTRNQILGMLFISPWLVGLLAFTAYPILASLYYSFTRYDIINPPVFTGLQNFTFMFTQDKEVPVVLGNTFYLVVVGVPLAL